MIAIRERHVASALEVCSEAVWRRRTVQVDLIFAQATFRVISLRIDPCWSRDDVRAVFAKLRRHSSEAGVVTLIAGYFSTMFRDETLFRRGAPVAPEDDGPASELADAALSHLTELHQPCWTYRAFSGGRLDITSRLDRVYTSLPSAIFSFEFGSASVQGDIYRRGGPSDHLPVVVWLRRRGPWDRRLLSPVDRGTFEDPRFYVALHASVAWCRLGDVAEAQEQSEAVKVVAREVAADTDLWPFAAVVPSARDRARLALRV